MKKYNVTGMGCAACVASVEKAVKEVKGVDSCAVSLLTNDMVVEGTAASSEIISAVENAGYGCSEQESSEDDEEPRLLEDTETPKLLKRLAVSAVLLIIQMVLMHLEILIPYSQIVLSLAVMGINYRFFVSGFKSVAHKAPNMDTLVSLGSIAAFIYGYYDSASMILTFITIGKTLEARSKGKTTDALKSLIQLAPKTNLRVGDEFSVYPGDNFPADGVVIEGETAVDESMLTGESDPVAKKVGDTISAATTNRVSTVKCKATAVGKDTTLSKIIELVSDTAASKAPIAKLADKVAGIFVPVVICIAVLVTIIWFVLSRDFGLALKYGISVLVISCPCAMGLATPVAIMVSSGRGAKCGILFKTAAAIEETGKIEMVALDKTGTLTYGSREITDVNSLESSSEEVQKTANTLKPDAKIAVEAIKRMGLSVCMITGDRKEKAQTIASECGIDEVISEVKPDGKNEAVRQLQENGKKVAMVGDGINDAPALTQADIGIAIGTGTDVAIDSASVVLMKGNLTDVYRALKLSRETLKVIKQNLFWAFFYNIIGIPIAAGALSPLGISLTPGLAALCMSLSSFCVCMNALRLNLVDINIKKVYNTRGFKNG